jgi:hypothetical protein
MIRFLGRELMGWLLVFIGLAIFFLCVLLFLNPGPEFIFEGPPLTLIGIIVFRGGIHLLKVAVAARICLEAQAQVQKPAPASAQRPQKAAAPWDW